MFHKAISTLLFFNPLAMNREAHRSEGTFSTVSDEPDAIEDPVNGSDYGSLLGLGAHKPKKKPVIVLDPAEAETAAQHIQHLAVQNWADAGKSGPIDALVDHDAPCTAGLDAALDSSGGGREAHVEEDGVSFREVIDIDAYAWSDEPFQPNALAGADKPIEAWIENQAGDPLMPISQAELEDSAIGDETSIADARNIPQELVEAQAVTDASKIAEPIELEIPAASEEAETLDENNEEAAFSEPAQLRASEHERPSPELELGIHSHSLRIRIAQNLQPHKTRTDEVVAFLCKLRDWMKRSRL